MKALLSLSVSNVETRWCFQARVSLHRPYRSKTGTRVHPRRTQQTLTNLENLCLLHSLQGWCKLIETTFKLKALLSFFHNQILNAGCFQAWVSLHLLRPTSLLRHLVVRLPSSYSPMLTSSQPRTSTDLCLVLPLESPSTRTVHPPPAPSARRHRPSRQQVLERRHRRGPPLPAHGHRPARHASRHPRDASRDHALLLPPPLSPPRQSAPPPPPPLHYRCYRSPPSQ